MLERALVKRLRDSDSDSEKEEEGSSSKSNVSNSDKPTDILTTDKNTETQVCMTSYTRLIAPMGGLSFIKSQTVYFVVFFFRTSLVSKETV